MPVLALEAQSIEMELAGIEGIHLIPNTQRSEPADAGADADADAGADSAMASALPVLSLLQADRGATDEEVAAAATATVRARTACKPAH
jgi:hypothetical protein